MIRYCIVCRNEIPQKRMKNTKVRFCSDECRSIDRHERAAIKADLKRSLGRCAACGRKFAQQGQQPSSARVHDGIR